PGGLTGPTHRYSGSTPDSAWPTELATCGLSDGFTTDSAEGDRWLELALDFRPGGSILAPVSQLGYERYVAACLDIPCEAQTPPPHGGSNCQCDDQYPCPFSPSYWKTHASAWPVSTFALGNETYTKTELLALLNSTVTGDASISLAQQLIAAKLNVANGSN